VKYTKLEHLYTLARSHEARACNQPHSNGTNAVHIFSSTAKRSINKETRFNDML